MTQNHIHVLKLHMAGLEELPRPGDGPLAVAVGSHRAACKGRREVSGVKPREGPFYNFFLSFAYIFYTFSFPLFSQHFFGLLGKRHG